MLAPQLLDHIMRLVQSHEHRDIANYRTAPIAGGDINTSYLLTTPSQRYFIKTLSQPDAQKMHLAEAQGLQALAQAASLTVPAVIGYGVVEGTSFLLLQGLALGGPRDWPALGRGLAELHRHTAPEFGWPENNFIGTTVQSNTTRTRWCDFWWQQRLLPQLELAYSNGYQQPLRRLAPELRETCERMLEQHQPQASLVHGDLWSGNVDFSADARPVTFDPACYYGDREVDIAMTQLFGGFSEDFYRTYDEAWGLSAGHQQRAVLYNLYHLLNHLNLFGSGYLNQCVNSIKQLYNPPS